MGSDPLQTKAQEIGDEQARVILARRKAALARRAATIDAHPRRMQMKMQVSVAGGAVEDATIHTTGYLVAGGDSWFDYPFYDVLKKLHDEHGYNVESSAHAGEAVEHMAYQGGQLDGIQRSFEKLAARRVTPLAVLLSGGGDDMAGKEFGMLLNNATSGAPGWNEDILRGLLDERIHGAYKVLIATINALCTATLKRTIQVIVHGYDYPVPDGRGVLGGFWFLPGPWLKPGFNEKLFEVLVENVGWMRGIIDRFNQMLATLPQAYDNVHYLDLRGTLSTVLEGNAYHQAWGNELHPTEEGFASIATKFSALIDRLHPA